MIKSCIKIFVFTKNQIHTTLKQTYKLKVMKNSITFMPKLASNTKFENYYRLMYYRKTKFQVFFQFKGVSYHTVVLTMLFLTAKQK